MTAPKTLETDELIQKARQLISNEIKKLEKKQKSKEGLGRGDRTDLNGLVKSLKSLIEQELALEKAYGDLDEIELKNRAREVMQKLGVLPEDMTDIVINKGTLHDREFNTVGDGLPNQEFGATGQQILIQHMAQKLSREPSESVQTEPLPILAIPKPID